MANVVTITVSIKDSATSALKNIATQASKSGQSAGQGFNAGFGKSMGTGATGALFGGKTSSVQSTANTAGQQAGQGFSRGLLQKFQSNMGSGLLSGLFGTSGSQKLFGAAGSTVVQSATAQGNAVGQGLSAGLNSSLSKASQQANSSLGGILSGSGAGNAAVNANNAGKNVGNSYSRGFLGSIASAFSKFKMPSVGGGKSGGPGGVAGVLDTGGVAGGALPGIAGVSGMAATVTGIGAALVAVLPAVIGLGAGLGVLGAAFILLDKTNENFAAGVKKDFAGIETVFTQAVKPLAGPFLAALTQVSAFVKSLAPQMDSLFSDAAPLIKPLVSALEGLVSGALPGFISMIKDGAPIFNAFASSMSGLGKDLGSMFQDFASSGAGSATIMKGIMGAVGALLPFIGDLAKILVSSMAPAFTAFSGALSKVLPALEPLMSIIGSFAGAVLGDLGGVLTAIGGLLVGLAPSFTKLAGVATNLFNTLENTGVFAILGNAIEGLTGPISNLVNALVIALAPALPGIINFFGQMAGIITEGLVSAIGGIANAFASIINAAPPSVINALAFAITGIVVAMKAWGIAQALINIGWISNIVDISGAFISATAGMSLGMKALVAQSLIMDSISPFGWAVLAVGVVGGLVYALSQLSNSSSSTVADLQKQYNQAGYNISVYKQISAEAGHVADSQANMANSIGISAGKIGGAVKEAIASSASAATALSQQAQQMADNLSSRLTAVSGMLGVSKTQVEQWATAAGISAQKFGGASENVGKLTSAISGYVDKNPQAVLAVSSLSTKIDIFSNSAFNATAQLDAFNSIWMTLVGNLLTQQEAVTNANLSFDNLSQTIKQNGKNSDTAKQSFQQYISQIGSSASTLESNGSSIGSINSYLQTQIDHIKTLGPLNNSEKSDLQGLTSFQNALANSTHGLTDSQKTLITQFEQSLIPDLTKLHIDTPKVTSDINNFTNSIIQTGNKSSTTAGDRAQLIKDLQNAGLSATNAKTYVNNLITSIGKLKGKVVDVGVIGTGSGGVTITAVQNSGGTQEVDINGRIAKSAAGGRVPGFGGGDIMPYLLEPGEAIVDKYRTAKYAKLLGAMGVRGFSSGGLVPGGIQGWVNSTATSYAGDVANMETIDVRSAMTSILKSIAKKNSDSAAYSGPGGGAPAANYALAQSLYPAYKGSAAMAAWNSVAMAESGWNQFARNPSSGAYGIAQALPPTKYPFAGQAAGGSNPTAQITWMWDYMAQTYGGPIGAWDHEQQYHWYAPGGATSAGWAMVGEHGRELVRMPGGATVMPAGATAAMRSDGSNVNVCFEISGTGNTAFDALMLKWLRENVRIKGGGSVQKAFGIGAG